jgi:hypothetical protein
MKRSIKPRKVGVMPWLIGMVLVGALLVGLFSFGKGRVLGGIPGLDIAQREWSLYTRLFDHSPTTADSSALPIIRFGGSNEVPQCAEEQHGGAWRTRWFEGTAYGDSVEVRNLLDQQGWLVRFKKDALYSEQRRMKLVPASHAGLRRKQLATVATELGLLTPGISFVRVLSCGKELGAYQAEEWVDADLLERRGINGASLIKQGLDPSRPDAQFAVIEADSAERTQLRGVLERTLSEVQRGNTDMLAGLVDEKAAMAWLLMAWIDGRDPRDAPVTFTYQWSTGHISPVYQAPAAPSVYRDHGPVLYNLLTPLLRRPSFRARFEQRQAELVAKHAEVQQRLDALTRTWSSLLAPKSGHVVGADPLVLSAEHLADTSAASRLDRELVAGHGHATFLAGMALPPVATGTVEDTAMLALVAKRYKLILQGDSVIFPRGKYLINEDLEFPAGRSVLMLQGARLFLAAGKSVLCKGDLYIRGTMRNPVFVRPQDDDAPFGSLALVGTGSQQCAISGLYISGGAGAKLAGMRCGGMVTVQGAARTVVASSVFQENVADASLLVNGGELQMRDVRCEDGAKEFVRLDHVLAVLREVTMVGAKNRTTTGLHVGTGTVAVVGGVYTALRGKAVLADGAAQVLIRKARLSQNAVAVRSEARASVQVEGNTIDGNDVVFSADPATSGSRITVFPNALSNNTTERDAGSGVSIVEKAAIDETVVAPFGIQLNEPAPEEKGARRGRSSRSGAAAN